MNWKKRISALALTLCMAVSLSVPALAAETVRRPAPQARQQAAETAVGYAMQYGGALSASWALWEDGAVTLSQTAANIPASLKDAGHFAGMGAGVGGTLYGVGSVSKMYTAAAVMKLAEEGKLSLDAPVTAYLKSFRMADPRYTKITVRMLLNHSSGLMGTSGASAFLFGDDDEQAADELLDRLAGQKLRAEPGAFSAYCNDGFTLAQLVVEAVSGMGLMDYVRSVLKPAGLENTVFSPADLASGKTDLSPAAVCTGDAAQRILPRDCVGVVGTGGMYAEAEDLAAFGGALTGTEVLSAASTAAMAAPEYDRGIWPDEPLGMMSYGLGWDAVQFWPFEQNNIQCLVKGGDTLRYHAALVVLPEYHMAAAVLTSGGLSTYNELAAAQILADALTARGVKLDRTEPSLPEAKPAAMPAALTAESGYYGTTIQQVKLTVRTDGTLTLHQMSAADVPDQTLTYYSDGSFRDASGAAAVKLVKESSGSTYLYQRSYTPVPGLGPVSTSDYVMVKMPENPVPEDQQSTWLTRLAGGLLPLAEKYTSQIYLAMADASAAASGISAAAESVPGYVGGMRIADASELIYDLPVGRDGNDAVLQDGILTVNGSPYQLGGSVRELSARSGVRSTIQPDGYARWYRVGAAAAGKTMTAAVPENACFYVYGKDGTLKASSFLWGDTSAALEEGDLVVFAGDPGACFRLTYAS